MKITVDVKLKKNMNWYDLYLGGVKVDDFQMLLEQDIFFRFEPETELLLIENCIMDGFNNVDDMIEARAIYLELINKLGVDTE